MPCPSHVLRGVKVQAARAGRQPCGRLPITLRFFINLEEFGCQVPKLSTTLLWAAATTTFFGFCRITVESKTKYDPHIHLSFADLAFNNATSSTAISIQIKHSKTDPFMKGVEPVLGKTQDDLCPVSALLAYLAIRGNAHGALFKWEDRKPMSKT